MKSSISLSFPTMNIIYQGFPGAYGHKASSAVAKGLHISEEKISGVRSFREVFTRIDQGDIGVLPIENSYAGSVHENFYHILGGNYMIIGEYFQDVNHFLVANTENLSNITEVYSHPQALMQCEGYLKSHSLEGKPYGDTAGAAKFVKESGSQTIAAISSDLAAEIYGLNILDSSIQDQIGNTTRFFTIVSTDTFEKNFKRENPLSKSKKMSLIFQAKDIPAALYKCLGAFATRSVNLTKIESLPAKENRFEYLFWIDIEKVASDAIISEVLEELRCFASKVQILGEY